jgi:hypothetical protein
MFFEQVEVTNVPQKKSNNFDRMYVFFFTWIGCTVPLFTKPFVCIQERWFRNIINPFLVFEIKFIDMLSSSAL